MKTLIISDVHQRIARLRRIEQQAGPVDLTIFLGDWFDERPPVPGTPEETSDFLMERLGDPRCRFLYGNHCLPYVFPRQFMRLTWDSAITASKMHKELRAKMRKHFLLTTEVDGYRLSHAGFSPDIAALGDPDETADAMLRYVIKQDLAGEYIGEKWLLRIGKARGGTTQETGGITWLDWSEFQPVPGMKQIVGHTTHWVPQWKKGNLALDTSLGHYAIIENGNIQVRRVDHSKHEPLLVSAA